MRLVPERPIPFEPWFKDTTQIAKLYRWLALVDKPPTDVALFIEAPEAYQADYDLMREAVRR